MLWKGGGVNVNIIRTRVFHKDFGQGPALRETTLSTTSKEL